MAFATLAIALWSPLAQELLEPVLPQYQTPAADVYAVYPQRHQFSTRVQAFVGFLAEALAGSTP